MKQKINWDQVHRVEKIAKKGSESVYSDYSASDFSAERLALNKSDRIAYIDLANRLLNPSKRYRKNIGRWLQLYEHFIKLVPKWIIDDEVSHLVAAVKAKHSSVRSNLDEQQQQQKIASFLATLDFIERNVSRNRSSNIYLPNIVFCCDMLEQENLYFNKDERLKFKIQLRKLVEQIATEKFKKWSSRSAKGKERWPDPFYLTDWLNVAISVAPSVALDPNYQTVKNRACWC